MDFKKLVKVPAVAAAMGFPGEIPVELVGKLVASYQLLETNDNPTIDDIKMAELKFNEELLAFEDTPDSIEAKVEEASAAATEA